MKSRRLHLAIVLAALSVLVAWGAHAQDLFLPPPVFQPEAKKEPEKKSPPLPSPLPVTARPKEKAKEKSNGPDPTLIIPPEVYELPRPVEGPPPEGRPGLLLTEGAVQPPPLFPQDGKGPAIPAPSIPVPEPKKSPLPPELPVPEPKTLVIPPVPPAPPEPTKVLVVQPIEKDPLPVVPKMPSEQPKVPIEPLPVVPKTPSELPKVQIEPMAKDPLPAVPKMPSELPKVQIEPIEPPPLIKKTPDAPPQPPTITFPPVQTQVTQPPPPAGKSFIRLNSSANEPTPPPIEPGPHKGTEPYNKDFPPPQPQPLPPTRLLKDFPPPSPVPLSGSQPNALVNLGTPAIQIEKRGPANLRAGETQSYQIVIRNLGPGLAQQVRIEDNIPAGVKLVDIGPPPQWQGAHAVWTLPNVVPGSEQIIRMTLKADRAVQLGNTLSAHVSANPLVQPTNTVSLRPPHSASALTTRLVGPETAAVGKPAVFEIHIANQSQVPLTGIVLFGYLPEGLDTKEGREIQGSVGGSLAPGATKVLRMPTNAVKPGRYTVRVKVVTNAGEASATSTLNIGSDSLTINQAPATRMFIGRDGDLQFQVANGTNSAVRNVAVACRLPEGIDFVGATDRGLYQSNHRTVYWLIDTMPPGHTHTLAVRVHGDKPGKLENLLFAKADGIAEIRSSGTIALEGTVNLKLNVLSRNPLLEVNKDTIYEVEIANTGGTPTRNVRLRAQFPAGMIPRDAQGSTKHAIAGQTVTFDPIVQLDGDGKSVFRISAHAQSAGDQRIEFSVISDDVQTPIQSEISTRVY